MNSIKNCKCKIKKHLRLARRLRGLAPIKNKKSPGCHFGFGAGRLIVSAMKWIFLTALFAALALPGAAAGRILFATDFSNGISNGWKNITFFTSPTDYTVMRGGTNCFLRGAADNSCSALTRRLDLKPPEKLMLRWRWKIDGVNTNGSERELKKFDHAARVFVAFHTFFGPPLSLNYLWGNVEKPGTMLPHPESRRTELFVVESGNAKAGRWVSEERDVTADWKRAFDGKTMPRIVAIGVLTDSDSLGGRLAGDYADIELIGE
jgi:hypothetical protein